MRGILKKLFTAILIVIGFNLLNAQNLTEGQLMFLTLSDEARPCQHNQLRSTYAWWQSVHNTGKNLFSLAESDVSSLQGIFAQSTGKARAITQNMMVALGLIEYQEPYILPEPGLKQNKINPRKAESSTGLPALMVFPNPAKEYMIIECVTESIPSSKMLQLFDINGKLVLEQGLDLKSCYSVIDLRKLPAGVYTGNVVVNGKLNGTFKVVLNR